METQEDIIKTIQLNNSEITLIGTAHVSQLSVEMVEEKIATGDYDCVAVELCAPRLENITNQAWWKNILPQENMIALQWSYVTRVWKI